MFTSDHERRIEKVLQLLSEYIFSHFYLLSLLVLLCCLKELRNFILRIVRNVVIVLLNAGLYESVFYFFIL